MKIPRLPSPGIRTRNETLELAWFSALCDDDYEYLGVPDPELRSSFAHCCKIVETADRGGFNNILLPSSYQLGQDPIAFAAAMAQRTRAIQLLVAIRCGEIHPPMLARALSTLDHMLEGRLGVNIISSDLPGLVQDSAFRYRRSEEVVRILWQAWTQEKMSIDGDHYHFELPAQPVKPYQQNGGPLLYFGGYSDHARELCAKLCDVYLLWPDTEDGLTRAVEDVARRAALHGRTLDYGLRVHIIVRETEREARKAADRLVSKLNPDIGQAIKHRAQDARSAGVGVQETLLRTADSNGYVEHLLWTGVGRARSGCGCALVGTPNQILEKLERYQAMGFRAFILSGYPHLEECQRVAEWILPRLSTGSLALLQGRRPSFIPSTPLTDRAR